LALIDHTAKRQLAICAEYGAVCSLPESRSKVGVALNVREGLVPLNGLRHPPSGDTNGWFIWAGEELSEEPDFFKPLHVEHLKEWCPEALEFLGLPPGWRFLVTKEYRDVWFDPELLRVEPA
jgi:hypothetical protein